jgi:hypothetical protein
MRTAQVQRIWLAAVSSFQESALRSLLWCLRRVKKFGYRRVEVERLHRCGIDNNGLQFVAKDRKRLSVSHWLLSRGLGCPQSHDSVKQRGTEHAEGKSEVCHSAKRVVQHETEMVRGHAQMMGPILLKRLSCSVPCKFSTESGS